MVSCILDFFGKHFVGILSLIAFFSSSYQAFATRKHFRTSLRPILMFYPNFYFKLDTPMGVIIKNNGLGPIIIKSLKMKLDGKNFVEKVINIQELFAYGRSKAKPLGYAPYDLNQINLTPGSVIGIQEEVILFQVVNIKKVPINFIFYETFFSLLQIEIEYESIYGERQDKAVLKFNYEQIQREVNYRLWITGEMFKQGPEEQK